MVWGLSVTTLFCGFIWVALFANSCVRQSYMHSKLKCELQRGIPGARVESLIDTFLDALVASHEFMRTQAIKGLRGSSFIL